MRHLPEPILFLVCVAAFVAAVAGLLIAILVWGPAGLSVATATFAGGFYGCRSVVEAQRRGYTGDRDWVE